MVLFFFALHTLQQSTIPIPLTEFISFKSKKPFVRICRWITLYDKETCKSHVTAKYDIIGHTVIPYIRIFSCISAKEFYVLCVY
uniref:Uncharacterized protein n=1 Tax=Rhizophagus irregularis (strain DAOM 181602 / DAOM 197198 / MUCL 43194) TaxID=747089 RepID=U9SKK7_RHIID